MKKTSSPVASTRVVDSMMAGVTKTRSSPNTVWLRVTNCRESGNKKGWYRSSPSCCSTCGRSSTAREKRYSQRCSNGVHYPFSRVVHLSHRSTTHNVTHATSHLLRYPPSSQLPAPRYPPTYLPTLDGSEKGRRGSSSLLGSMATWPDSSTRRGFFVAMPLAVTVADTDLTARGKMRCAASPRAAWR